MKMVSKSTLLTLLVILGVLHVIAIYFYIYWTAPGFDVFMHALGGAFAGLFSLGMAQEIYGESLTRRKAFFWAIIGAIFIGALWECFEFCTGMTFTTSHNFTSDTTIDMIMDVAGALLIYIFSLAKA